MSAVVEKPSIQQIDEPSEHKLSGSLVVALAGNPNADKTSLFNALTGLKQKVANYPGVTVERKEGVWQLDDALQVAKLIDLPGLYSLDATSIDEQIARDCLSGRGTTPPPDVIVAVVDATNLERNLYLVTQLLEFNRPLVIALTMVDLIEQRGASVDTESLARELGVPVVAVSVPQRKGFRTLALTVERAAQKPSQSNGAYSLRFSSNAERELDLLRDSLENLDESNATRHDALTALYSDALPDNQTLRKKVLEARARLESSDANWWQEPLVARYEFVEKASAGTIVPGDIERTHRRADLTERIDRILTHRIFGFAILVLLMLVIFQTIFSWANLPMDLIDQGFGLLGSFVRETLPAGLLTDLLVDGVIAGVGGVLVFLPQIALLFFFITLLEDSGYMARAAFLMDRLMRGVGLHGKAFLPLLSSFACAIPGIMATRTIENRKDRIATIMIAPLMSCSARLPVYALMIGAFFAGKTVLGFVSVGALVIMAMYLLGIITAVAVAFLLKRTLLKHPTPPLIMEMPPYRVPNLFTVFQTVVSRSNMFVKRAGTVILAISIILWALATFPRIDASERLQQADGATVGEMVRETGVEAKGDRTSEQTSTDESDAESALKGEQLRQSFAGRAGRLIEPVILPLGFDWRIGISLISSFAARETLVSTLSIVYNVGTDANEETPSLLEAIRNAKRDDGTPAWTPLVAVSLMVFFVLACQCMSTVAIVRRETNSWAWATFMVGYMLALAYAASFVTYQGGLLLGFS